MSNNLELTMQELAKSLTVMNYDYADFEKYVEINKIPDEVYYDEIVPTYCTKHQKNISDSFNMSVCSDFKMFKLR